MKTKITQMLQRIEKGFSELSKNLTTLSFSNFILLALPIVMFFCGIFRNPLLALVVGGIYLVGFVGLMIFYESAQKDTPRLKFTYLILGWLLVVISWMWLEIISKLAFNI